MKRKSLIGDVAAYLILGFAGISMLIPFAWMTIASLRDKTEFFRQVGGLFPSGVHWENYLTA